MSYIFNRLEGLNTIILYSRSAKDGWKSFRRLVDFEVELIFISFIIDLATSDSSELISSSVGWPVKRHIF
jgi:hypothetical protein